MYTWRNEEQECTWIEDSNLINLKWFQGAYNVWKIGTQVRPEVFEHFCYRNLRYYVRGREKVHIEYILYTNLFPLPHNQVLVDYRPFRVSVVTIEQLLTIMRKLNSWA